MFPAVFFVGIWQLYYIKKLSNCQWINIRFSFSLLKRKSLPQLRQALVFVLFPKIFIAEWHVFHRESTAFEIIEDTGIGGKVKGEPVRIQGLAGLAVALVHLAPAVLAVAQQRAAQIGKRSTDLVGTSGQQLHLHQRQLAPLFQRAVLGHCRFAAGDRLMVDGHFLLLLILQKEALDLPFRRLGRTHGDAQITLIQLPVTDLLVDDAQRFGVLGGDDDAAGVAVDAVAQGLG